VAEVIDMLRVEMDSTQALLVCPRAEDQSRESIT
jgi:hypothetical protein